MLTGSPVASAAPLLGLAQLTSFDVGTARAPGEGMDQLLALPRFMTFCTGAPRLAIREAPMQGIAEPMAAADTVWTRRAGSNVFDTVSTDPATGAQTTGIGAITGAQAPGEIQLLMFLHRRSGNTVRYLAQVSDDGASASGMVTRDRTLVGECSITAA
jgi:hypothetical protein